MKNARTLAFMLLFSVVATLYAAPEPNSARINPSIERQVGPDGFGYRLVDNRNESRGPAFNWIEIAGTAGGPGSRIPFTQDDQSITVSLFPFVFPYYGTNYSDSLYVCTNGFLAFNTRATNFDNTALPNGTITQPALFVMWDDMTPVQGGTAWYWHDAQNHRFIVEWKDMSYGLAPLSRNTFQAHLYESGYIEYHYLTVGSVNNSSTIGLQGPNGGTSNRYLSYAVNGNPVVPSDSLAIRFAFSLAKISVTVRDSVTNLPIPNARVELFTARNYYATTDTNGLTNFNWIRTGNYRIRVNAPSYSSVTTTQFALANTDSLTFTILLPAQSQILSGPTGLTATTVIPHSIQLSWRQPSTPTDVIRLRNEHDVLVSALQIRSNEYPGDPRIAKLQSKLARCEDELRALEARQTLDETDALFGYNVYRIFDGDTSLIAFRSLPTDTSYLDAGLQDGEWYTYFIRAVYDEGLSLNSNTAGAFARPYGGYELTDTLAWVDLARRGTSLVYGDDALSSYVKLPFAFTYFDDRLDSFQVCTNGFIGEYLAPQDAYARFIGVEFQSEYPRPIIAGCFSDLIIPRDSMRAVYDTSNARYIVSIQAASYFDDPASRVSFQYHFYVDGRIGIVQRYNQSAVSQIPFCTGLIPRSGVAYQYGSYVTPAPATFHTRFYQRRTDFGDLQCNIRFSPHTELFLEVSSNTYPRTRFRCAPSDSVIHANNLEAGLYTVGLFSQFGILLDTTVTIINGQNTIIQFDYNTSDHLAPEVRSASSNYDNGVYFQWSEPRTTARVTSYRLYRNDTLIAPILPTQFSYFDSSRGSAGEGIAANYRLSATYATAPTEVFFRDTMRLTYNMPPASPRNLRVATIDSTHIRFDWDSVFYNQDRTIAVDVVTCQLYGYDPNSTAEPVLLSTVPGTQPNCIYNSATAYPEYFLRAVDDAQPVNLSFPSASVTDPRVPRYQLEPFVWFDTNNWTELSLGVNETATIPLGFGFQMYGYPAAWATISSNGYIGFYDIHPVGYVATQLPDPAEPNEVIAPLWFALDCSRGRVKYNTSDRMFGVSYENVYTSTGTYIGSFQVIMNRNSSNVCFSYRDSLPDLPYTVGIENQAGLNGIALLQAGVGVLPRAPRTTVSVGASSHLTCTLRGRITQSDGTTPIPNTNFIFKRNQRVHAFTQSVRTDANGNYQVQVLKGSVNLIVTDSCQSAFDTTLVINSDSLLLNIRCREWNVSTVPTSIEMNANSGTWVSRFLTLSTNRSEPVNWSASIVYRNTSADGIEVPQTPLPIDDTPKEATTEFANPAIDPSTDQLWGPDRFGYRAYDRTETAYPVGETFRDITAIGTEVLAGDDNAAIVSLNGFVVSFYGNNYATARITTNGVMQFVTDTSSSGARANTSLPNAATTNALIPLWDDLETRVFLYNDTQRNELTVQWNGNRYPTISDTVRFQIRISGANQQILYLYDRIRVPALSATVGIQGGTGAFSNFLQCYYGASGGQGLPANMNGWGVVFYNPQYPRTASWLMLSQSSGVLTVANPTTEIEVAARADTSIAIGTTLQADIRFHTSSCSTLVVPVTFVTSAVAEHGNLALPNAFEVSECHPNPFNATSSFRIGLPASTAVSVTMYDVTGREVLHRNYPALPAGYHDVRIDGQSIASGLYLIRVSGAGTTLTRKAVLLK